MLIFFLTFKYCTIFFSYAEKMNLFVWESFVKSIGYVMNAVFFIVHISGRKSVYHSCIMMYENIIVDDSTIIYNNYACQPLIIFIFFVAYDIAQVVHCLICVTVHEQTLHFMNHMSVSLYVYFSLYQPSTSSICALLVFHIKKKPRCFIIGK